jgi:hypothetical protein
LQSQARNTIGKKLRPTTTNLSSTKNTQQTISKVSIFNIYFCLKTKIPSKLQPNKNKQSFDRPRNKKP